MTVTPSRAQSAAPHQAEFQPFYTDFLPAVRTNIEYIEGAYQITAYTIGRP